MIAATVTVLLVLPLLVLRGRTLLRYAGIDAATWIFAWLLWRRLPHFDPYLFVVAVAVIKLATFLVFVAAGRQVRWSANRAAAIAGIVYALTIPAMLRTPIDGDEPFYLLLTESIVRDFDLDLANQYGSLATSETGRRDLDPQFGDPRGREGEQYSRHEPFLALLMVPGYLAGGLHGALATIALFGVLLVRSTIRWMEDEGIGDEAIRGVFPFFAFAPPVLFYATRIWPEVPAAFFFVEAMRGVREHRAKRWLPALLGLVLLKLRFVLVAAGMVAAGVAKMGFGRGSGESRPMARNLAIAAAILLLPLLVIALITGDPTSVHTWRELLPAAPMAYAMGLSGLLADGMSGIAFQAPFYLFAGIAVTRWKKAPSGFRLGIVSSLLYVLLLLPRAEWFGGWAPPLRYLVFLMPVLALGIAAVWDAIPRGVLAAAGAWTVGLVIHGCAYPWRLFHEFTGENAMGEWLSERYDADFSRVFPSFIRLNDAAWWGLVLVVAVVLVQRRRQNGGGWAALQIVAIALLMAGAFQVARRPGTVVHFEDSHVVHSGGKIYPDLYTVIRTAYRGGWVLEEGDSLSFLARGGTYTLHLITGLGATFELGGQAFSVTPDLRYQRVRVHVPRTGRVTLRTLSGAINVDRMERDD